MKFFTLVVCGVLGLAAACSSPPSENRIASMVIISGDGQSGVVGTELPLPLVVQVLDGSSQPIAGAVVNFRVTSGGGSVFAGAALTDSSGHAEEHWTLGTSVATPEALEVRAVDSTTGAELTYAHFTAVATRGLRKRFVAVTPNPASGVAGEFVTPPTVRLVDDFGNPVPVRNVAVTFTANYGSGVITGGTALTNTQGQATLGSWRLGNVPFAANTVTVTSPSMVPYTLTANAQPVSLALEVSPGSYDFGDVHNAGNENLFYLTNVSNVTVSSATPFLPLPSSSDSEFGVDYGNCYPRTLAPGDFCIFGAVVTPPPYIGAGSRRAVVTFPFSFVGANGAVVTTAQAEVKVNDLSGLQGTPKPADFYPSFGPVPVGTTVGPITVTFTNYDPSSVRLGTGELRLYDTGDFSLANDTCTGTTLATGQACTIDTYFTPTAAGNRLTVLAFPTDWGINYEGIVQVQGYSY